MLQPVLLPASLPWTALASPLAAAEDKLARLDERIATSPIREGCIARADFADATASVLLEGELVSIEDLVLHDAQMDVRHPTPSLSRAHAILRTRRRIFRREPEWALSPRGLAALTGREGSKAHTAPKRAARSPEETAFAEALAAVDAAIERSSRRLAGEAAREQVLDDGSDQEDEEEARLRKWSRFAVSTSELPPVLAAALVLDAWDSFEPAPQTPWLGRLLVAALLRQRGKTKAHLCALSVGLRAISRERRRSRDTNTRLIAGLDGIAAAAAAGLADHDRWIATRNQFARRFAGHRATSKLPAVADYVLAHPIVSAGMIAKDLHITPRAARNLVTDLGLREITGRTRYRAWCVL